MLLLIMMMTMGRHVKTLIDHDDYNDDDVEHDEDDGEYDAGDFR